MYDKFKFKFRIAAAVLLPAKECEFVLIYTVYLNIKKT